MRIMCQTSFASLKHAEAIAQSVRDVGIRVTPTQARNVTGRMLGYHTWREFVATCPLVGIASASDEDCEPYVVAQRRAWQAGVLAQEFDLPVALARHIVDTVKPTARGSQSADPAEAASEESRTKLARLRGADGFVTASLAETPVPAGKPVFVAEFAGATIRVWLHKAEMYKRAQAVVPHRFEALATLEGQIVGVLRGYGVSERIKGSLAYRGSIGGISFSEIMTEAALFDFADLMVDAYGPDVGANAHTALRNQGTGTGSVNSPSPTDGLVFPTTWETAAGRAAPGLGFEMWKALFKAYESKRWGYGTVLINPEPPQYASVNPLVRHAKLGYQMARTRIFDSLTLLVDEEDVLRPPMFLEFRTPHVVANKAPTRTAGTEPHPLKDHQWPSDYDMGWVFSPEARVKVAPSPVLWRNMPSELAKITVVYEEVCLAGSDGFTATPGKWEFHFANGTALMLCDDALADFTANRKVFPFLCDRDGAPLPHNPYTSRMTIKDMLDVLATNVSLVFGGNPDREGRDSGRITLSRT